MSDLTERIREGAQSLLQKASDLQERIRRRAHAIWEREGRPHGRDQDHWRETESELAGEEAGAAPAPSVAKKPTAEQVETKPAAAPAKRTRGAEAGAARR